MKYVIILLNCLMLWSCAATRHAAVPADARAQMEALLEGRHYAVAFRYPRVDTPDTWAQERAVCCVLGDTLQFFSHYDSQMRVPDMNFRIEDYRQSTLESGAIEVAFSAREMLPDGESPVAKHWRFVIYSPERVEIHLDDALIAGSTVTVFKGTLHPVAKK